MGERGAVEFIDYYGEDDGFDIAKDPRCLYGWGPSRDKPGPGGCRHMFGHFCTRPYGHAGRCMDDVPTPRLPCESVKRPADWDDRAREECNR